jgi:hypothetical protein
MSNVRPEKLPLVFWLKKVKAIKYNHAKVAALQGEDQRLALSWKRSGCCAWLHEYQREEEKSDLAV